MVIPCGVMNLSTSYLLLIGYLSLKYLLSMKSLQHNLIREIDYHKYLYKNIDVFEVAHKSYDGL